MRVLIRLPAALRTPGEVVPFPVEVSDDATVADLLDVLAVAHPAAERRIRNELGEVRPHVNLFAGDRNIRELAGPATALRAEDEVTVLAAISGG